MEKKIYRSKLLPKELSELLKKTKELLEKDPSQRVGQALFNSFEEETKARIKGINCDPQYIDGNVSACIKKLCPEDLHYIYVPKFQALIKERYKSV